MFLIQRKKDGKFWRNKGYHQDSSWRFTKCKPEDDPRWVSELSQCVPFTSPQGARSSRCPVPNSYLDPATWKRMGWDYKRYCKAYSIMHRVVFDGLYNIVPVTMKVER